MLRRPAATRALVVLCLVFAAQPAAARLYHVDPAHSSVRFSVPYDFMILGEVHGEFRDFFSRVLYAEEDLAESSVRVVLKTASLDTDLDPRDRQLRGEDFFAADRFPTITFQSSRLEPSDGRHHLVGILRLRGVEEEVTVPFEMAQVGDTLVVSGTAWLDRRAFGMGPTGELAAGTFRMGERISVSLHLLLRPAGEGEVVKVPEEELERYAGRYRSADQDAEALLEVLDGTLTATFTGQRLAALLPAGDGVFRIAGAPEGFRVRFRTGGDGAVEALVLEQRNLREVTLRPVD